MNRARERLQVLLDQGGPSCVSQWPEIARDIETVLDPISPYDYHHAAKRSEDRARELLRPAGRRLHGCRAAGQLRDVIEALPDSSMKLELTNLTNTVLRLLLIENDGHQPSHSRVNAF